MVEFVARFTRDDLPGSLHEISRFRRQGDTWLYVRGRARWRA
jgi:SEC-C motif-containing protein